MFRRGASHIDIERGKHVSSHSFSLRSFLRRYSFIFVIVSCACLLLIITQGLRRLSQRRLVDSEHETCARKLARLGVDTTNGGPASVRENIYARMDGNILQNGLSLGGVITQGLKQSDLFVFSEVATSGVTITPVLKPLDIPVRAMILPLLDYEVSGRIKASVEKLLLPVLPIGAVWMQDSKLYHATLYHASSHAIPVQATPNEVEEEARAIRGVAGSSCPIKGVLDRIIITTSGVIVACWQVQASGTEPTDLRKDLAQALPKSPPKEGQMVKEPSILHTTIARLLKPPEEIGQSVEATAVELAVRELSNSLCGVTAAFEEVWFVEEQDLLALALEGHYIKHPAPLRCPRTST
ncbi:hypothetical protein CEUSTIGMA_g5618.t1 [Chlamydomonas eustigma]|uniref:Uncharacterized protein n=1 Tax=Chlamydomonas eustigma TaxID=1157962 RepID=A0A250X555_9CHLO|nr:hypothetical protein CEUSTIGMA_g5618.t1 [Chlamydomonas eustigma]|eukprot:GAX78176.1 hypothetical protein CEUSTIGMA_g5618.t1 [Chlamydomonas eustigma]